MKGCFFFLAALWLRRARGICRLFADLRPANTPTARGYVLAANGCAHTPRYLLNKAIS